MKSGCNFSKILPTSSRFSIEKQSLLSSSRPHPAVVMDSAEQSPRTVFVTHIIRVCVFLTKPELANPFEIFLAFVEAGLSYDNLVARASPVDADPHLSATKAKKNLFLTSVSILSLRHLARFSHIFAHVFLSLLCFPEMLDPEFSTDSRCPGVTSPFLLSIPGRTKTRIETSVSKLRTSMCFEKHTVNRCIHQGGSNMIRRGKRMRPFRRIAFNFCNITNTAVTFRGAAGVGRLAADAEDRNSKNCRRRRRLFKTLVVQDVITDAVLSPDIIDAAPSNRSKKKTSTDTETL